MLPGLGNASRVAKRAPAFNPNQQTKVYVEKVRDIVGRNSQHFTTSNPDNHIILLSSALSKSVSVLEAGDTMRIKRVRTAVNESVEKIKAELKYISASIW